MSSSIRHHAVQAISWALAAAVVLGALALLVVPKATGSRPLTVLSGSMAGTYDVGDAVVVRPVDPAELRVGDVITFQPVSDEPALTTHRIIGETFGGDGRMFVTQGDANPAADANPVKPEQVKGEVWYSVPLVGYASVWLAGDRAQAAIHALAALLLLYGAYFVVSGLLERRRPRAVTS